MTPHDKIGLIIGFALLGVLLVALFFVFYRIWQGMKQNKAQDDESFNNFMNKKL